MQTTAASNLKAPTAPAKPMASLKKVTTPVAAPAAIQPIAVQPAAKLNPIQPKLTLGNTNPVAPTPVAVQPNPEGVTAVSKADLKAKTKETKETKETEKSKVKKKGKKSGPKQIPTILGLLVFSSLTE